ncbi:expressed unknown protein [Seminavis robusta]|uniref:Uncharacterized protein n=1 Tax=Seminavis robusta TaxID=568900 RepID=A0A9N8HRA2_9STRA|nr:expressed unknown protein [Seminavis robusta]|eukprot:Sro1058_g236340.1 n/a (209) ;mRNA; f:5944-6638
MLGAVNGRENFDKIHPIVVDESRLVCTFPASRSLSVAKDFPFGSIVMDHMPTAEQRHEEKLDRIGLEKLAPEEAKDLLAALLQREDRLRLHPRIQAVFGSIGESEQEMSRFTTALQAHVASEFNVDEVVGVELIRSATTLFPDTAKLAHYVRHNRCFQGDLRVGDRAPDVELLTLAAERSTLWTEIDKRRAGVGHQLKACVVLGASFT